MTPEKLQIRYDKLIHVCQGEIICETKLAAATTDIEKQLPMVNLVGAHAERDALLKKWGLYPTITWRNAKTAVKP